MSTLHRQPKRIALLADLSYRSPASPTLTTEEMGAILLRRAVERLNRFIQPDLVVLIGDLLAQPASPNALNDLYHLRSILNRLQCPYLVVRGRNDPDPALFYNVFPRVSAVSHLGDIRVLCHADEHRDRSFDTSFPNPLDQIHSIAHSNQLTICLGRSGHQALGVVLTDRIQYIPTDALHKRPFPYVIVCIDQSGAIACDRHSLAMPESLGLMDLHSHTQMAYCAGDVQAGHSASVAHAMGLQALAFTEHSGHLYFNRVDFNSGECCVAGIDAAPSGDERVNPYFRLIRGLETSFPTFLGMEIDADYAGSLVVRQDHRTKLGWAIGAVHFIPPNARDDHASFVSAFQKMTEGICDSGIEALAHPFRIFRRQKRDEPRELYPWMAKVLKRTGVAAEINFHTNEPTPEFVQMCVESGIKLTFGSDAHDLWEVGEFFGHLQLLKNLGISRDVSNYLLQPATNHYPAAVSA